MDQDAQLPTKEGKANMWNHPFWVVDKKAWIEVKDLNVGDRVILSDGKEVAISGIRSYNVEATKVYNFEVADNHTYFVGEDGVLVHNYDLDYLFNNILSWQSIIPGSNDAIAVKEKFEDCSINPGKCTGEYYANLAKTSLKVSGGLELSSTRSIGASAAPFVLSSMIKYPTIAYPFWKTAAMLDYEASIGLDDNSNAFINMSAGKGPIKSNLKFSVNSFNGNINSPELGVGLKISPNQKMHVYHNENFEINNRTINDYNLIYGK